MFAGEAYNVEQGVNRRDFLRPSGMKLPDAGSTRRPVSPIPLLRPFSQHQRRHGIHRVHALPRAARSIAEYPTARRPSTDATRSRRSVAHCVTRRFSTRATPRVRAATTSPSCCIRICCCTTWELDSRTGLRRVWRRVATGGQRRCGGSARDSFSALRRTSDLGQAIQRLHAESAVGSRRFRSRVQCAAGPRLSEDIDQFPSPVEV